MLFCSRGHIPDGTGYRRKFLKSRSVADIRPLKRVTFQREESFRRRSIGSDAESYLQIDLRNNPNLPPLPSILPAFHINPEKEQRALYESDLHPTDGKDSTDSIPKVPISFLRGWHKVDLDTTYLYAPEERLLETVKYNPKAIIPQITPRQVPSQTQKDRLYERTRKGISQPSSVQSSALSLDLVAGLGSNCTSGQSSPRKKYELVNAPRDKSVTSSTPRDKPARSTEPIEAFFGVRPECLFIDAQLGDKNPLQKTATKSTKSSKSKMTANEVPKASGTSFLQDLKDYAEYPGEYTFTEKLYLTSRCSAACLRQKRAQFEQLETYRTKF